MINQEETMNYYRRYFLSHFVYCEDLYKFIRWIDMMVYNKIDWDRFIYVIEYVEPKWNEYWTTFLDDIEKND